MSGIRWRADRARCPGPLTIGGGSGIMNRVREVIRNHEFLLLRLRESWITSHGQWITNKFIYFGMNHESWRSFVDESWIIELKKATSHEYLKSNYPASTSDKQFCKHYVRKSSFGAHRPFARLPFPKFWFRPPFSKFPDHDSWFSTNQAPDNSQPNRRRETFIPVRRRVTEHVAKPPFSPSKVLTQLGYL